MDRGGEAEPIGRWGLAEIERLFALRHCFRAGQFDLNDSVFHYTLVDRIVQAIERGENPLDCWVSEWTLGYPVPRTYQILGHISVALLYFVLGKTVSVLTLFVWARFLLIAFLPLTVYVSARLLMLPISAAVASAALSPLIATNNLYGLEYGSYLWRGNGLFTQAVAMHFLLLTLGFGFRVTYNVTPAFAVYGTINPTWAAEKVDTDTGCGATTVAQANAGCTTRLTVNDRSWVEGDSRYIGTELDLGVTWRFAPNVALDLLGAYLFAGNALNTAECVALGGAGVGTGNPCGTGGTVVRRDANDAYQATARVRLSF